MPSKEDGGLTISLNGPTRQVLLHSFLLLSLLLPFALALALALAHLLLQVPELHLSSGGGGSPVVRRKARARYYGSPVVPASPPPSVNKEEPSEDKAKEEPINEGGATNRRKRWYSGIPEDETEEKGKGSRSYKELKLVEQKCCIENCQEACTAMANEDKLKLENEFKADTLVESKNKMINHLRTQRNLALEVDKFSWQGVSYCSKVFSKATGFTLYLVEEVLRRHSAGVEVFRHGNAGLPKNSLMATKFRVWVHGFLKRYGQSAPDNNVQVINSWITVHQMYLIYLEESTEPFLKEKTFYSYFHRFFGEGREDKTEPQVRISSDSSHSVCDQCVAYSQARKGAKTKEQLETLDNSKKLHMAKVSLARRKMEEIKQEAIQFPEDSLVIQVDGMDQKKSWLPRFLDKSKKNVGLQRLPTKIVGCNIFSGLYEEKRKVVMLINHDHYENGSNMVNTVLFKLIKIFYSDHDMLPKDLHLFMDNCWRENKNRFVFALLDLLVQLGVFRSVTLNFLVVGHTGNEVDQLFSILAHEFKSSDIRTVDELKMKIRNSPIVPKPVVETLWYTWDFKSFISPHLNPLSSHSFFNSFQITKEAGLVRFRCKKLPQSPEYGPPGGLKLIKDGVKLEPIGAADFRIEQLELDKMLRNFEVVFEHLELEDKMNVMGSWNSVRKDLQALPFRMDGMEKMDLESLPRQVQESIGKLLIAQAYFVCTASFPLVLLPFGFASFLTSGAG